MTQILLPSRGASSSILKPVTPRVYINGLRQYDWEVASWEWLERPPFGQALIQPIQPHHFSQISRCPKLGSEIRLTPPLGHAGLQMTGYMAACDEKLIGGKPSIQVRVEHELMQLDGIPLAGQWLEDQESPQYFPDVSLEFNTSPKHYASEDAYVLNSKSTRLFQPDGDGCRWSVAEAMNYLLSVFCPRGISCPGREELISLAGHIDLGEYRVCSKGFWAVIMEMAHRAGLQVRPVGTTDCGIVFYRSREGRCRRLNLQPVGESLDIGQTDFVEAQIERSPRQSHHSVRVIGDRPYYESTFTLQPGWPALQTPDLWHDSTLDFGGADKKNAFRLWVLDEHGRYAKEGIGDGPFDITELDADDFTGHRPRRFLPTLTGHGIVVEYRLNEQSGWRYWTGPLCVSREECSIYLGGNMLPGDFYAAGVAGTLDVRITATVQADVPIDVMLSGCPDRPIRILRRPDMVKHIVHSQGQFSESGEEVLRDDTPLLRQLAESKMKNQAANVGKITLPNADLAWRLGDVIKKISGRHVNLPEGTHVMQVRHTFLSNPSTTLFLET